MSLARRHLNNRNKRGNKGDDQQPDQTRCAEFRGTSPRNSIEPNRISWLRHAIRVGRKRGDFGGSEVTRSRRGRPATIAPALPQRSPGRSAGVSPRAAAARLRRRGPRSTSASSRVGADDLTLDVARLKISLPRPRQVEPRLEPTYVFTGPSAANATSVVVRPMWTSSLRRPGGCEPRRAVGDRSSLERRDRSSRRAKRRRSNSVQSANGRASRSNSTYF